MNRPTAQIDLFGNELNASLVETKPAKPKPSRSQRLFDELSAQIVRERERLANAEQRLRDFRERLFTALQPVLLRVRVAQRKLVLRIDHLLSTQAPGKRLSQRHRSRLEYFIVGILKDLLTDASADDVELAELHAKYVSTHEQSANQAELEEAEAMLSAMFGDDVLEGHAARDAEELFAHVRGTVSEREQAAEQAREQAQAERRRKRGGPSKAELAAARKQEAAQAASASVRDIYRKLVSSLHPDREPDATERERKTALLQRANQAYERGDLLALFALQLEIAQIDADHLVSLPEERIKHYIAMLREQLRSVQEMVAEEEEEFEFMFDLPGPNVDLVWAERAIKRQVKHAKAVLGCIEQDLRAIDDPKRRPTLLDTLPDPPSTAMAEPDFDFLGEMLGEFSPPPATRSRRAKQRPKRKR